MEGVLAIDQGTTGSTALVIARDGRVLARAYSEFTQHFPKPGWVEHDAEEIWQVSRRVMAEALAASGLQAGSVAAIGITNQRETTVIWDRDSGTPVHRAVVWQSRQSVDICKRLRHEGHEQLFRSRTGLMLDAYFSGSKIRWILDQDPALQRRAERGELAFGTIDSWLLWKLSGGSSTAGAVHCTEPTNASRTLLYDIHERRWDPELCSLLNVPAALLPEVRPSAGVFAHTAALDGLPSGIPIAGMAGDQQAALYGQGCWLSGQAKNTYGTGCFLLMNMGGEHPISTQGLLTTLCCDASGGPAYALEGSVYYAGATVQWLRDELGIIRQAAETDALARQLEDNEGVYLVPAFSGLGAPWWDSDARGAVLGLTRGSGRAHLARAALEAMAYQTRDIVAAMRRDSGVSLSTLRVDGGAASNDFLMQFQADLLGVPVERPQLLDSTAAGSAYLAGLATGLWSRPEEVLAASRVERRFLPVMATPRRQALYDGWRAAVGRVRSTGTVQHDCGSRGTADGISLFWQRWLPADPRGVICLVHGLAEHSGRYRHTALALARAGWAVYACDLRGHGWSADGRRPGRVHVDSFEDYLHDLETLRALAAERHPQLRCVALGHSMGGLIVLRYVLDQPQAVDGAVISSPALGTHPDSQPPAALQLLAGLLSRVAPRLLIASKLDAGAVSRDPEVVEAYLADPLVSRRVSARWYRAMVEAMSGVNARAAELRVPVLLMQSGADRLVDPAATRLWASSAPTELVELVEWPGLYHEMFNEPEQGQVMARVVSWLEQVLAH